MDEFDTVDFVSEGVVAASFITQEPAPPLEHRDDPNRAPLYRLHAVFLDATSGNVLKTLDWPLDNPNAGIFPRYDGSFLFLSTERIVLYSPDWTPAKELPLPQLQQPHSYLAGIAESPSGKLLVVRFHQGSAIRCIRIPTDSLEGTEEPCEIPEQFTISDGAMAESELGRDRTENNDFGPLVQYNLPIPKESPNPDPKKVLIRETGKPVRALCDIALLEKNQGKRRAEELVPGNMHCPGGFPQFISNEMVVIYGGSDLLLLDLAGALKFEKDFAPRGGPHPDMIDNMGRPVRASANGRRFALALNDPINEGVVRPGRTTIIPEPGDPPAAFPDRVEVYDLSNSRWIYVLENEPASVNWLSGKQFPQIWGLGLSPSGEKLTIDSGGVIQTYALPPASPPAR